MKNLTIRILIALAGTVFGSGVAWGVLNQKVDTTSKVIAAHCTQQLIKEADLAQQVGDLSKAVAVNTSEVANLKEAIKELSRKIDKIK